MYREENGYVVLTLTPDDYERLLLALGVATASPAMDMNSMLGLVNRINEGNPNFTPYAIPEKTR